MTGIGDLRRCPFVRAVADGRVDDARALAVRGPEPAEPVVVDRPLIEARRHLDDEAGA